MKVITLALAAVMLCATPAMAQRSGGGSRGGGSHSSSSHVSSSRSSSSFSSPSRSSSSSSSVRSSSSHSSSPRSSSSFSSPSRSSSSSVRSSSSHSSSPRSSSSFSSPSRSSAPSGVHSGSPRSGNSGYSPRSAASSIRGGGNVGSAPRGSAPRGGGINATPRVHSRGGNNAGVSHPKAPAGAAHGYGGPSSDPSRHPNYEGRGAGYARPGHHGPLPPSHRPIHPAPYFYHPWHHHMVHCHPIFWDPIPPRPWYWPGFWAYCNSYWFDYHVTDVVVVREYVNNTYKVDMVTYGISGDIMYAIVRDGGETYLQVYDKEDHLLAEQKIHRKYCNLVIDAENGGCWISKKHEKDPLLFLWTDGQLLIYEAD
ncbi:MAG: hypothetical protein J6W95_03780 [Bacteroidales bacterium]|nr:hypothetical protein [Bacteroidales bacterium]